MSHPGPERDLSHLTRRTTAAATARQVREFLHAGAPHNALRAVWQVAADLAAVGPDLRVLLAADPPAPTGDPRFDALIAAVVDHLLEGLPRPSWVSDPSRTLADPWDVEPVPALRAQARAVTPPAISQHGVWLDPEELVNR